MQLNAKVAVVGQRLKSTPEDVRSMPMAGAGTLNDGQVACDAGDGVRCAAVDGVLRPVGIVVHQHIGKNGSDATGKEAYKQFDVPPIMRVGRIWVKPAVAITATGGKVYVRSANATTNNPMGSLQTSATDGTELVGATWDSISNADGMAIVQLRGA
ncbi:structural cement protein Gp24 [Acinetobacter proteolyticus]|uniref:structural cement protein Gp24 n=1 Tax=Acinetobacter proteolyticus TaxID=1776741 RepID=UPI0031D265F2